MISAVVFGLIDAFNPCLLSTSFFLMFLIFELAKRGGNVSKYTAFFIATSYVSLLLFSTGLLMPILYAKRFFEIGRIFYFIVGALLIVWGCVHFRDWWGLVRGGKQHPIMAPFVAGPYAQKALSVKVLIGIIVVAVVLAAMSTVWPPSQYIFISSTYLFVPGKSADTFIMLLIYNFILVVPLLGVYLFAESDFFSRWLHQAPTMVKMVFSALLIALGSGIIYIFW